MKLLLMALFLMGIGLTSFAQQPDEGATASAVTAAPAAKVGTFQLIQVGKYKEVIQNELLVDIEARRHATLVQYYQLSPNTLVMIASKAEIERPDFRPLPLYKDEQQ